MKKLLLSLVLLLATYCNVFAFLTQGHWRWRNNDGTEKTATWKAAQDSAITISDYKAIRLRVDVYNEQSSTKGIGGTLEYATNTRGPWLSLSTSVVSGGAFVFGGSNAYISENDTTSAQLTGATGYTFKHGSIYTLSEDHNDSITVKQRKEFEWCIKPTSYIMPNTKYYFRVSTGANQTTNLPTLTTTNAFAAPAALLSNGSFEQGLNGWTNHDGNGSNTFALQDTAVYDGNTALRTVVTNTGTANSLNVYTQHSTSFPTSSTHIYLIRFWAKASVNAALLTLGFNDPANSSIAYKLSTDWQRYQYVFKTNQPSLIATFYYLSKAAYVLDNVTVVDDTDPIDDVNMTYMWQDNRSGYGWLTADGQESIKLPDGRVAWFFSDTWLGTNNPNNNYTNTNQLVNNDMVVQTGTPPNGTLATYFTGTSSSPKALMIPVTPKGAQSWYWPRDPIIENNTLKILLPESERVNANDLPTNAGIESVATFSLPDLILQKIEDLPYLNNNANYSVLIEGDDGFTYAYGGNSDSPQDKAIMARYPKGQLSASVAWQFWNGTSWTNNPATSAPVAPYAFGTIIKLDSANYAAVFEPNLTNSLHVMYATSPAGPWVNNTLLYQIPVLNGGLTYFGYLHKETGNNGVYTLSYSSNTTIQQMLNDKGTYQPHYVKANLLALSPYTKKAGTSYVTSTNRTSAGKTATAFFTMSKPGNDHFILEQSTDLNNWSAIASIKGTDTTTNGTSYKMNFPNPHNGLKYYRLKIFDVDDIMSISPTSTYNVKENAALSSFTASAASQTSVNLDFGTSSEFLNEGFVLQRSVNDTLHYQTFTQVEGAGTSAQAHSYHVSDNSATVGVNYYRLAYYANGVVTAIVRKVDTRQTSTAVVLNVYPNPSPAAVKFNLNGYVGRTFTATLTNLFGKQISQQTFKVNNDGAYTLTGAAPSTGTFILNINGDQLTKSTRVIVNN